MNFDLTDDQREIRRTAREFLAARYPLETVRAVALDGEPDPHWDEIAELGWPDIAELGTVELAVLAEQLGYALAPSPLPATWAAKLLHPGLEGRGTVAMWDEEITGTDFSKAWHSIAVMAAAESVGVAARVTAMTVDYAKERKQFGRAIGSYQAVSHACAQMFLETEGARNVAYWAAWALDHDPDAAVMAAHSAKAYASDAAVNVCRSSLQVHGGIGFTWEHDLHLFLKRAEANAHAFGDARWHREQVAGLLL